MARNRVQRYYKFLNCANFLTRKFFNKYKKLSKTKMQIPQNELFVIFIVLKSFPKRQVACDFWLFIMKNFPIINLLFISTKSHLGHVVHWVGCHPTKVSCSRLFPRASFLNHWGPFWTNVEILSHHHPVIPESFPSHSRIIPEPFPRDNRKIGSVFFNRLQRQIISKLAFFSSYLKK